MHDVVFVHPPASFRKLRYPLSGLFESATGTSDLLTMAPLGMLSLANELQRAGHRTAVVNLAKLVQRQREGGPDPLEDFFVRYPARIYAIDLHWAAHASGALELAELCRRRSPSSLVLLGGLSATYFCDEILSSYSFVDAVVRGECDGHAAAIFAPLLLDPPRLELAPNLAYRAADARTVRQNPQLPPDLRATDYLDRHGLVHPQPAPGRIEREALILNLPLVRGCNQACLFCGGSRRAYGRAFGRQHVEMLPVDKVAEQVRGAAQRGMQACKLFGDPRLGGREYERLLRAALQELGHGPLLFIELFWPAEEQFLRDWREISGELILTLSPESSHPELRELHGKRYSNQVLLEQARLYRDLDIIGWFCFAYLLPGHNPENLAAELGFIERLLEVNPDAGIIFQPYLFLDPAAELFEEPAGHGYQISLTSLEFIRRATERAYWLHSIGYRTPAFSEQEFHRAILEVTSRKADLYFRTGRLCARDLLKTRLNLDCHRRLAGRLLAEPGLSDDEVQELVTELFPDFLRRTNSNLLIRPYFGESPPPSSPDSLLYDAFAVCLELVSRTSPASLSSIEMDLVRFGRERHAELPGLLASVELPGSLAVMARSWLAELCLPERLESDLLNLEWALFRLLCCGSGPEALPGEPFGPAARLIRTDYDLTSVSALVDALSASGRPPSPRQTWYVLDGVGHQCYALSFDPGQVPEPPRPVHIERLSAVERRAIRMERTVGRLLARAAGGRDLLLPEVLVAGEELRFEEIRARLPAHLAEVVRPASHAIAGA